MNLRIAHLDEKPVETNEKLKQPGVVVEMFPVVQTTKKIEEVQKPVRRPDPESLFGDFY